MTKTTTDPIPVVQTTNMEYAQRTTGLAPLTMKIRDIRLSDDGIFEFSATFQNGQTYYDRVHLMVLGKLDCFHNVLCFSLQFHFSIMVM